METQSGTETTQRIIEVLASLAVAAGYDTDWQTIAREIESGNRSEATRVAIDLLKQVLSEWSE